ncbi:myoD family inhibitor [Pyxicephalus adspersus]|uniref:myoD family inhibitor n=1 Tax=Pyxicephalus adspersus TaxID=30357 RepID=UPI003B5914CF
MSLEMYFPHEHTCTASLESESSHVEVKEEIEQDKLTSPMNGMPQMSEMIEPSPITCISTVSPVTQGPKSSSRSQCHPYLGDNANNVPKNSSQNKMSSLPHLEKQCSKTSKGGAELPYLPPGAQEDCCVHCTLALLFCQFLSLCNLLLDLLTCGSCSPDSAGICCSCCSIGGCPDCADSCNTDCGIVDACCESADCLEICMECCGLCFSS